MNNLIFINHQLLFCYDKAIANNTHYKEYFSIYNRFPFPPGIEYIMPRNMQFNDLGIKSPWHFKPSSFPIPAMPGESISFSDAADSFGEHISKQIDCGKQIYLLWSGGIDSTCVVVSVLRNIRPDQRNSIHIVSSEKSKLENPVFYYKFLDKFNQLEFGEFDPANIDISNSLLLDGEGGDQIFGSSAANRVFSIHPELIMLPWRDNIKFLKQQWQSPTDSEFWDRFFAMMLLTIDKGTAPVETLYDFYWWLNFNFKIDSSMFRSGMYLANNIADDKFEDFFKNSICRFYTWDKIQQWSMSAGAFDKIGHARKMTKYAGRRYIYEFDKNEYYFREKRKEFSLPLRHEALALNIAVDQNFKRYSIGNRAVRQSLRNTFYNDVSGRINFHMINIEEPDNFIMTSSVDS